MKAQLYQIIQILSDGKSHSGQALGAQLGITRSAIWKYIRQLSEKGIPIESSRSTGYRIAGGLSLLNAHPIIQHLDPSTRARLCDIHVVSETASTTQQVLTLGHHPGQPGTVCFAEYQNQGKGRRSRHWLAPHASNLLCSLIWRFKAGFSGLSGLSLVTGLALYQALKQAGIGHGLGVKWPNDIVYRGKKLAGVLTEFRGEGYGETQVVLSFGVNVTIPPGWMHDVPFPWVDLASILATTPDRNKLAAMILNQLVTNLLTFEQHGFSVFLDAWQSADATLGQSVKLQGSGTPTFGIVRGINEQGELLIQVEQGHIQTYHFGDISLRAEDGGYVPPHRT